MLVITNDSFEGDERFVRLVEDVDVPMKPQWTSRDEMDMGGGSDTSKIPAARLD